MSECEWCNAGLFLMGAYHFEHGDAWTYPCVRGPIERELRDIPSRGAYLYRAAKGMSLEAFKVFTYAAESASLPADAEWCDIMSEAIEAAAELRL